MQQHQTCRGCIDLSVHDLSVRDTNNNRFIICELMSGRNPNDANKSRVRKLSFLGSIHQPDGIKENGDDDQKHSQNKGGNSDARRQTENSGSNDGGSTKEEYVLKQRKTTQHGSSGRSSTTPLPKKMILLLTLKRLQQKDTYGEFSKPVNPKELPDYHGVIKHPMDLGTIKRKLDGGAYNSLEEFETDVFLVCSNAMHCNAEDTVYYRQAQTMKDLAEQDFAKLKGEPNKLEKDYQLQPKATATSRVNLEFFKNNMKKLLETPKLSNNNHNYSSWKAELTASIVKANKKRKIKALMDKDSNVTNKVHGSESPQEEKREMPAQQATNDLRRSDLTKVKAEPYDEEENQPQNPKAPVDARAVRTGYNDWRDEFPAHIVGEYEADKKAKRPLSPVDMNRRHTYKKFQPEPAKDVIQFEAPYPERLEDPYAYARSLARYARDLGPTAWKIASKKIEAALPPGTPFGPGWIIDPTDERNREAVPKIDLSLPSVEAKPTPNDNYGLSDEMVEAILRFNRSQPDPPQRSNAAGKRPLTKAQEAFQRLKMRSRMYSPSNRARVQGNVNVARPLRFFLPHQYQMQGGNVVPPFPFSNMPFPNVQGNPYYQMGMNDFGGFFNFQQYPPLNPFQMQEGGRNNGGLFMNPQAQLQAGNNYGGFFLGQQNPAGSTSRRVRFQADQDRPQMQGNSYGGFFTDEQNQGGGSAFPTDPTAAFNPGPNYFTNLLNSFDMAAADASQKGFVTYEPAGAYYDYSFMHNSGEPSSSNRRGLHMPPRGNRTAYAPAVDLSLKMNSNVVVPGLALPEDSASDEEEH